MSCQIAFRIAFVLSGGLCILLTFQHCCDKEPREHYIIKNINPAITKGGDSNQTSLCAGVNSSSADTIWIDLGARSEMVAFNNLNQGWNLISTANAKSPCPPKPENFQGLKHHLKDVEIKLIGDTTYNKTNDVILMDRRRQGTVSEWLGQKNNWFPRCVQIQKFDTEDTLFQASVKFSFENGEVLQAKTDTFTWKME